MKVAHPYNALLLSALLCFNSACGSKQSVTRPTSPTSDGGQSNGSEWNQFWKDKGFHFKWDKPVPGFSGLRFSGVASRCSLDSTYTSRALLELSGSFGDGNIHLIGEAASDELQLVPLVESPVRVFQHHIVLTGTATPSRGYCSSVVMPLNFVYQVDLQARTASVTKAIGDRLTMTCHGKDGSATITKIYPGIGFLPIEGIPLVTSNTKECSEDFPN